jgi:hypothetical protein
MRARPKVCDGTRSRSDEILQIEVDMTGRLCQGECAIIAEAWRNGRGRRSCVPRQRQIIRKTDRVNPAGR